jgi:hypothetical protein
LEELADYQPPLDLLAKLPSSPFSQSRRRARWWSEKAKEKEWMSALKFVKGDEGRELVRVLTGEEELEGLTTPKVGQLSFSIECSVDLVGYSDHWSTRYLSLTVENWKRADWQELVNP